MRKSDGQRAVLRTVLLVGEGYAEVAFIAHLKALYLPRGCGIALTVKNARGKGALHVVEVSICQSRNSAFDVRAVLLDTDTDWNEKTQAMARKAKVQVGGLSSLPGGDVACTARRDGAKQVFSAA